MSPRVEHSKDRVASSRHSDYGVIGNVTNLAARLSDAAKGGEILTTATVRAELRERFGFEPVGELEIAGFHAPQAAFRLIPGDEAR